MEKLGRLGPEEAEQSSGGASGGDDREATTRVVGSS